MEGHFWINPLQLDKNAVDGQATGKNTKFESRHTRSVDRSESTEATFKEDSIRAFLRSAQTAYDQIENLKEHMIDVQYPHLEPDSLSSHQYDFLSIPDKITTNKDTSLLETFHHFQKCAVTLFQVLKETEEVEKNSEYYTMLQDSKDKMVQLLCDIQLAIEVFDLKPFEDVTYAMLPSHMKDKKRLSNKSIRDYLVMREYSNFLGFVLNQKDKFLILTS